MENLISESIRRLKTVSLTFKRYLYYRINWNNRLIAIKGPGGSGKTTLILQYIKSNLPDDNTVLYIPLGHIYFYEYSILNLVEEFVKTGGKYLFLDDIHKYPDWSKELNYIYDSYPGLRIVYTSSLLSEFEYEGSSQSRKEVAYKLNIMSLREYINMTTGELFTSLKLEDLLKNHIQLSQEIDQKVTPILEYRKYLKSGAYPLITEENTNTSNNLIAEVNRLLDNELVLIKNIDFSTVLKIKKLLFVICSSAPFKPNITKLSNYIDVTRPTLLKLIQYLANAQLLIQLRDRDKEISRYTKPDRVYMHNTNLIYNFIGFTRENESVHSTFFLNQVSAEHMVNYYEEADFLVDDYYIFDMAGRSKNPKQIRNSENTFIVKDNIVTGTKNIIPLWLFGFLY